MDENAWNRVVVTPEAITACGHLCTGLGEAIKGAAAAGDKELVKELGGELTRVSKSLSWLLREDRGNFSGFKKQGKTDGKITTTPNA